MVMKKWPTDSRYVFGADFETDHDESMTETWMVQWALSKGDFEWYGTDLEGFEQAVLKQATERRNIYVYFHNLKFDSQFFLTLQKKWEDEGAEVFINRRSGAIFSISFEFTGQNNPYHGNTIERYYRPCRVEFRDSLKKIQAELSEIGTMIGLPKLDGGDFHAGWSKEIDMDDPASWEYIRRDARIVAVAMRLKHDTGMTRGTSAGDAWHAAKGMIYGIGGKALWAKYFPRVPLSEDREIRKAYLGGLNISEHKGKIELVPGTGIYHVDKHSMYPTVMKFYPLPCGRPAELYEEPLCGLYIAKGRYKLHLKEGMIPWFTFKNKVDYDAEGIGPTEPVVDCREWHELTLTSVDIALIKGWYELEVDQEYPDAVWYAFDS
jgi:hypothetical protein